MKVYINLEKLIKYLRVRPKVSFVSFEVEGNETMGFCTISKGIITIILFSNSIEKYNNFLRIIHLF